MLHADAVKANAPGYSTAGQMWFKAIDAKTLDKVITEMNEMNRWFAKVVKYWDDFTSGGDGTSVLEKHGRGIEADSGESEIIKEASEYEKETPSESEIVNGEENDFDDDHMIEEEISNGEDLVPEEDTIYEDSIEEDQPVTSDIVEEEDRIETQEGVKAGEEYCVSVEESEPIENEGPMVNQVGEYPIGEGPLNHIEEYPSEE